MADSTTIAQIQDHQLFDRSYYLAHNQDVARRADIDPLTHYLSHGAWEGRNPHPLFDSAFYLEQNPHIAEQQINPLIHFLTEGARQGLDPHPLFSTRFYLDQGLSMEECSFNPLIHYLESGAQESLDPHPLFDSAFYLQQLERLEGKAVACNPLAHYLTVGAQRGLEPSLAFDSKGYYKRNPDVAYAGINPLLHYVTVGRAEGRMSFRGKTGTSLCGRIGRSFRGLKTRLIRRLGLSKHIAFRQRVNILGKTIEIPIVRGYGEELINLEPSFTYDVLRLLQKTLPVEDFVDVGANIGQTLLELRLFSDRVRYIGFEPNPLAYSIVTELIRANNFQCLIVPCGLSDSSAVTPLFKTSPIDGAATILPQIRPGKYSKHDCESVVCLRLDDALEGIEPLKKHFVLKIDAEGAEYKILLGANRCISTVRPVIICEVLHSHNEEALPQSREHKGNIERYLVDRNYRLYQIELHPGDWHRQNLKSLRPISEFPVDIYANSPDTCEFLFLPGELSDALQLA